MVSSSSLDTSHAVTDETFGLLGSLPKLQNHSIICKAGLLLLAFACAAGFAACPVPGSAGLRRFEELLGFEMPRLRAMAPQGSSQSLRRLREAARVVRLHRPGRVEEKSYRVAQCVGAIYDLANFVGWAGLNIDALTIPGLCPDTDTDKSCSANGVGLVFNLLWVATNAAQLPIWCVTNATSASLNSCGVSTGLFLASSLQIVSDGLATKNDCAYLQKNGVDVAGFQAKVQKRIAAVQSAGKMVPRRRRSKRKRLPPDPWVRMHSRRLQAEIVNLPGETRAQALGVCSMMVMQLANDLPYFGLSVWATAQDCRNAGLGSSSSDEDCAADSFGVLSDIVNFATDFLVILASCQENFTAELPCTADSTDITSAALGLGSWALTVEHACNPFHNETEEVEYIEEEPLDQFIPLSRDR